MEQTILILWSLVQRKYPIKMIIDEILLSEDSAQRPLNASVMNVRGNLFSQ